MNIAEIKNINKQYPDSDVKANCNINFNLKKGEILCIAGENGAGKTTLMKILCNLEKQDSGQVKLNGNTAMVHQHFMLFPEYTVAENIVLGKEPRKFGIFFDFKKAKYISEKIINKNNFSIINKINNKVKELTVGEMQQVEICRILYQNTDIIILDEPTSILTFEETQALFNTLKKLIINGKSIIFITHKLQEIKQIANRVLILRQGNLVKISDISEIDIDEISRLMINGEIENGTDKTVFQNNLNYIKDKTPILSFKNVTVMRHGQKRPLLDNVSFSVNSGEILGFTGIGGNGLGVIEAVLGGFLHPVSGKVMYKDKDISQFDTHALRKQGLAYVPADRINVASAKEASIKENIDINRKNYNFKDNKYYSKIIEKYNIDAPDLNKKCLTLSGGNLQKIILGREIDNLKDYIVFSEPTWGLDVKSSRFVLKEIDTLRKNGAAVILISTNLDEILELSNRIIVMYKGKIKGEYINKNENNLKEIINKNKHGKSNNITGIENE
ncbi:MAG: ATP-binding cassette domain-containing protein [Treponema sp.]|nr:ATP-binding cassette domain-containing protein [Treponema sp.]